MPALGASLWSFSKIGSGSVRGVERRLKTGIAGAGVFGGHHARKHAASPRIDLAGVFDPDSSRAAALAAETGARAFDHYDSLLAGVDAVAIAAPAGAHFGMARRALEAGRHVYVEKPLALSLAEADALIALAEARGLALQVGHQERFVLAAMGLPRGDRLPLAMEFGRSGPATGRGEDVAVTLDLMIHDLDLARLFGFARPLKIDACGGYDETVATLTFDGGKTASFVASRRSDVRQRLMKAVYDDGEIEIDFLNRTILNRTGAMLAANDFAGGPAALADPLGASVEAFAAAALDGKRAVIDGKAGRGALEWALMIEEALEASGYSRKFA
ncbi:MAG TPA: gfo/Idh/MocA family oxidoreductase [Parvularcula sp.]|nr:gfo/Idh/MocA family oxidoreductase [Parvularcula sp.]